MIPTNDVVENGDVRYNYPPTGPLGCPTSITNWGNGTVGLFGGTILRNRASSCPAGYVWYAHLPQNTPCAAKIDYIITLSGGTSVEPWHKKSDAAHTKTNLTYTATVKDASGQAVPNIPVLITTDVTQDSGGHVHIDGRHKGKLAIPSDPIKDGKETISGNTDSNGVFAFTFGSEEASGMHTITAKCTGCQALATATVTVAIQGLSLLNADPLSYTLNGEKSWHPGSHYFSAAALTKILNLAFVYSHDPSFNKQLLIINDSSLIKGGVLDLGQDWTYTPNGHQGHRIGVVVDINNYRDGPSQKFEDLAKKCCNINAVWEGPDVTSTPHYHLRLLGKDQ
ncbi:MAG: hypothetical protein FD173_2224 [Gallionellaceae bacterium]|nr:MAG: hypothetical protein FD173_2224 [Gallionellaceae bacterium]